METGVEYIITTEAAYLMKINGYCTKHNLPVRAIQLIDILTANN